MKLTVTQKHINKGKREKECFCPIAQALKEQLDIPQDADFHSSEYVEVGDEYAFVYVNGRETRKYKLPKKASKFVVNFDDLGHKAVKPFTFTMVRE